MDSDEDLALARAVNAGLIDASARALVEQLDRHGVGVLVGVFDGRIYVAGLDAAMALELVTLLADTEPRDSRS